jgi:phosphate transport system permease protein
MATTFGRLGDTNTTARVQAELAKSGDARGRAFQYLLLGGLFLALIILILLIETVIQDGWSVFTDRGLIDFLSSPLRSEAAEAGVFQGLRGSFWIAVMVALIAFPIGIGSAVYLEEYAGKTRFARTVDLAIRNLAGVPSVVYGILGLTVFVQGYRVPVLGWETADWTGGPSLLSAGLTLSILVLPIVIITAAEAVRAVPQSLREASYGVGATKWETVKDTVLPYAAPGILTGTLLSLARAIGEAAPLILVGAVTGRLATAHEGWFDFGQLTDRFTAMPIVITRWATLPEREFNVTNTAAAIIVLLVFVLLLNSAAIVLRNRFEKKRQG